MKNVIPRFINGRTALCAAVGLYLSTHQSAADPTRSRIVVVPMFSIDGNHISDSGRIRSHYLTLIGPMENRLARDFEVVDALATETGIKEYQRTMDKAGKDTALAVRNLAQKYAVDLVYVVDMEVNVKALEDGFFEASAKVQGRGFDSANRNLGLNLDRSYKHSSEDRDNAIVEVEKEAGRSLARILTDHPLASSPVPVPTGAPAQQVTGEPPAALRQDGKSPLERRGAREAETILIRLDGTTTAEAAEAFGKILNGAIGVADAKLFSANLDPSSRQNCYAVWRVRLRDTDPFRLQANIKKDIDDILQHSTGEYWLRGIPYRNSKDELALLRGIYPRSQTSREIQFYIDPDRVEDQELRQKFE